MNVYWFIWGSVPLVRLCSVTLLAALHFVQRCTRGWESHMHSYHTCKVKAATDCHLIYCSSRLNFHYCKDGHTSHNSPHPDFTLITFSCFFYTISLNYIKLWNQWTKLQIQNNTLFAILHLPLAVTVIYCTNKSAPATQAYRQWGVTNYFSLHFNKHKPH
jgi:hypothetical protein